MKEYIEPEVEVIEYCIMDIIAASTPLYGSDVSVSSIDDDTFGGEGGNPGGNGGGFGGENGGYSQGDGEDEWIVD